MTTDIFVKINDLVEKSNKNKSERTNMLVWTGSGFSKSWNENFPLSSELFNISNYFGEYSNNDYPILESYLNNYYQDVERFRLDFQQIKKINYQLFIQKKFPNIQNHFFDNQLSDLLKSELKKIIFDKFQKYITFPDEYTNFNSVHTSDQKKIIAFFKYLLNIDHNSTFPSSNGLQVNFVTSNYDFILEEIINECYRKDNFPSFIDMFVYRGFTPFTINSVKNTQYLNYNNHHHLLKLNGGFEIFSENGKINIDYRKNIIHQILDNNHKECEIILPSYNQDYSNSYYNSVFQKCLKLVQDADILLLIGTSLPEEDYFIHQVLSNFATSYDDYESKRILYINFDKDEMKSRDRIIDLLPGFLHKNYQIDIFEYGFNEFIDYCIRIPSIEKYL